ncbi:Lrp/AsnC family transcriptional regulator [Bradyrhizobium sp. GM0.4]
MKWNKVLQMTDLAVPLPETSRRLDAIDRKILMVLQDDASLSVAEIGDRVGLSSTPCWKRIQRLEADGVITKRVALVDQNKIGLGISVFVSVESSDHSDAWLKRFADAVSAMPEVMEFYRMAGDVDYMLRVVVADMQAYDVFYKKLISAVPLKNVTSRFAMEKIQVGHRAADPGCGCGLRLTTRKLSSPGLTGRSSIPETMMGFG